MYAIIACVVCLLIGVWIGMMIFGCLMMSDEDLLPTPQLPSKVQTDELSLN